MQKRWIVVQRRAITLPRMGFTQAEKNGDLVLVWEKHWTKISGFFINTRWGSVWIQFRRRKVRR
jgi:hypothetical protein